MIRETPGWFADELARVGGTNRYGDPIFQLVWSTDPRMVVGGRFADGFVGYRRVQAIPGTPCWALTIWEAPETYGDPELWKIQYRDAATGLLEMGAFPREGRRRLLKRLEHRELQESSLFEMVSTPKGQRMRRVRPRRMETHKIEPSGFILDLMVPMLLAWRRLGSAQKFEAVMEQKRLREKEAERLTKDAIADCRVRRGSQLVQKRAELIERGMDEAMRMAARYGHGMAVAS